MPKATAYYFADAGSIPNNPTLPMLIYPSAIDPTSALADAATAFEDLFAQNHWTGGSWRNGIYSFPHYHSTAHEILGIASGRAELRLGGETGTVLTVQAGDAALLPAGCGHQNLGASSDLLGVGAYPPGPDWDLCRGEPGERTLVRENIARVPLPKTDPVGGQQGPVFEYWLKR